MASVSATNVTRFGTSVQVTGRGADAVARFWASGGNVPQSTTPDDRIQNATKRVKKNKAKGKGGRKATGV